MGHRQVAASITEPNLISAGSPEMGMDLGDGNGYENGYGYGIHLVGG